MEEHHAVANHYWPSPLTVLAGFATRTSRMMLGTNILVAPFYTRCVWPKKWPCST